MLQEINGLGEAQTLNGSLEDLEVTVGTRSTYTAVPRQLLERLGVPVEGSVPAETADGRITQVDVGTATIRLQGREFPTQVIFAEEGDPRLLGIVALGVAFLAVDPVSGWLVPTNGLR